MPQQYLFILVCLILYSAGTQSQSISRSVISILGKETTDSHMLVNHTAGEAFAGTVYANFRYLTQGFQQPDLLDFNDTENEGFDAIDVYPNPVNINSNYTLTVSFRINIISDYVIKIYDTRGSQLYFDELNGLVSSDIKIDMARFRQGIYFVHVYSRQMRMNRFFKIERF